VVTVPVHARDIKRGTLSGILSDAGISRDEFLEALK
jgi:predicted RNA binding protein YcfA (HicA-like mRNA interferase family)